MKWKMKKTVSDSQVPYISAMDGGHSSERFPGILCENGKFSANYKKKLRLTLSMQMHSYITITTA